MLNFVEINLVLYLRESTYIKTNNVTQKTNYISIELYQNKQKK